MFTYPSRLSKSNHNDPFLYQGTWQRYVYAPRFAYQRALRGDRRRRAEISLRGPAAKIVPAESPTKPGCFQAVLDYNQAAHVVLPKALHRDVKVASEPVSMSWLNGVSDRAGGEAAAILPFASMMLGADHSDPAQHHHSEGQPPNLATLDKPAHYGI